MTKTQIFPNILNEVLHLKIISLNKSPIFEYAGGDTEGNIVTEAMYQDAVTYLKNIDNLPIKDLKKHRQVNPMLLMADYHRQHGNFYEANGLLQYAKTALAQLADTPFSDPEKTDLCQRKICILNISYFNSIKPQTVNEADEDPFIEQVNNIKTRLENLRDDCRPQVESIKQLPSQTPEEQKEKINQIKALFGSIDDTISDIFLEILSAALTILNIDPSEIAILTFGSKSRGEGTPYSDIEWHIVIKTKKTDSEKEIYRTFTKLVHYLLVSLGETILPCIGIKGLNDYLSDNPEDRWFYDGVIKRGLSPDGASLVACKTPLGRPRTADDDGFELILSPEEYANLVEKHSVPTEDFSKCDQKLADMLSTSQYFTGNEDIYNQYKQLVNDRNSKILPNCCSLAQERSMQLMKENLETFAPRIGEFVDPQGEFIVKTTFYRFIVTSISFIDAYFLAAPYSFGPLFEAGRTVSSWDQIDRFQELALKDGTQNMSYLTAMILLLRLMTYLNHDRQTESYRGHMDEQEKENARKMLMEIYQRFLPLYQETNAFYDRVSQRNSSAAFFSQSNLLSGSIQPNTFFIPGYNDPAHGELIYDTLKEVNMINPDTGEFELDYDVMETVFESSNYFKDSRDRTSVTTDDDAWQEALILTLKNVFRDQLIIKALAYNRLFETEKAKETVSQLRPLIEDEEFIRNNPELVMGLMKIVREPEPKLTEAEEFDAFMKRREELGLLGSAGQEGTGPDQSEAAEFEAFLQRQSASGLLEGEGAAAASAADQDQTDADEFDEFMRKQEGK